MVKKFCNIPLLVINPYNLTFVDIPIYGVLLSASEEPIIVYFSP